MVELRKTAGVNRTVQERKPTVVDQREAYTPPPPTPSPAPTTFGPGSGHDRASVYDPIGKVKEQVAQAQKIGEEQVKKTVTAQQAAAANPYDYENYQYNYTPQLQVDPERQYAPSLGLQRYQADAGVNSAAQSGYLTGASNLASTTGLSMADRKALQQQSQRARVMGSQSAQSPFNQMQAQNLYDTDQFNVQNRQKVAAANQGIMNQYEADKAEFERKKAEVIFEQKMADARLQQALEGASHTAY